VALQFVKNAGSISAAIKQLEALEEAIGDKIPF
jgi:hypothetical protein